MHPSQSLRGQRSHAVFNMLQPYVLYIASSFIPAIKETLLRVESMKVARTQCAMVLSAVHKNSIVHSTVPVHIPVQQLGTPIHTRTVYANLGPQVLRSTEYNFPSPEDRVHFRHLMCPSYLASNPYFQQNYT